MKERLQHMRIPTFTQKEMRKDGNGNSNSVHSLPFWWEGAVLKFLPSSQKGGEEGGEVV